MTDNLTVEIAGLMEELEALYVWPQSVADHHADILTPRQIENLYAVGHVGQAAADTILALAAENEALKAENERLENERAEQWRLRRDAEGSRDVAKAACTTLRAQLAEAVGALEEAYGSIHADEIISATLAKLKGSTDD